MVRIDCLIFGYRRLQIDPNDLSKLTSIFIRSGIFSSIENNGSIVVRERDISKIQALLKGRIEYSCSEPLGIYGKWLRLEHKRPVIAAALISVLITIVLSSLVWDVRIDGNELISDEEIIEELSDLGFGIGRAWINVNRGELESDFLLNNSDIAWININRRGTVAYVSVIENKSSNDHIEAVPTGYSNIVAMFDCVIEEITVKKGTAVVKTGDAVKKGDLLVAGVLPLEAGGGFCYAEAEVKGRVSDSISSEIERIYDKKEYQRTKLAKITLNFFNFSINIFKIYGNLTSECDIIENEIEYTHLDRIKLPFSISISYLPIFEMTQGEYSDDEMVKLVSDRLNLLVNQRLRSADLLKIKTFGEFTDNGFSMRSEILLLCEVGENIEFK